MDLWINDGTNKVSVNALVIMSAWTTQGFYWDTKTGVLLAIEEESKVEITLSVGLMNHDSYFRIDLTSSTSIENKILMQLETHPNQYLTEQTEFPVTGDTPITLSDTQSTTSDDTKSESDDLLPVPILPMLSGLSIITLHKRRSKRIK